MISVLTVNYHASADVQGLAASLERHSEGHGLELIVTNNSPGDPIRLAFDAGFPVKVLPSRNIGYAAGINLTRQHAGGDVLFITNPDVRIRSGTLSRAIRYLEENPEVGIVFPLLRDTGGKLQLSVRRFYTWPVVLYARSPLRALNYRPRFFRRYLYEEMDRSKPMEVDWGLGGAMFLRAADVQGEPIFDERFFLYFEDVDLCYRTWARGRRIVYCPQCQCVHAHHRGSRRPFTRAGWHHFRSLVKFIVKYRGLPDRPRRLE